MSITPPPDLSAEDDVPVFDFADPNSRLAPLYARTGHIVAAGLLAIIFLLVGSCPVWHTDVWGHLRFGEYLVQNRRLPEHEMFSGDFADQAAPYVNYQWLSQAGAYLLFDLGRQLAPPDADHQLGGGAVLLGTTHAALVTLRFFLLLLAFRRLTGSLPFAVLGVFLSFLLGYFYHIPILRPQVVGELAFAALLLALSRPVLSRPAVVALPVVMVLWANGHGSFPVGFVLLGAAATARVLTVSWQARNAHPATGPRRVLDALRYDVAARRLTVALALSLAGVALLNPHGPALFRLAWDLSQNPNIATMNEWQPLPLNFLGGGVFFGSLLVALALLAADRRRVTVLQVLLLVGFGWQTLVHARMFIWWAMIVIWVLLPHLHAVWRRGLPDWLAEADQPNLRKTILAVLTAGVLVLWTPAAQWICFGEAPLGTRRLAPATPLAAADYLRQQYAAEPALDRCVFTSETLGDYLLWDLRLDPPVRVTAYTHVHLLTEEHWRAWRRAKGGDPEWEALLDRMHAQFVVLDPDERTGAGLLIQRVRAVPQRWQVVLDTPTVFVARRSSGN